jgi:hypothetical protein
MLNLKKITTTVSLLSLGALSIALFGTGCDDSKNCGTGGAGGKSSTGGQGGTSANGGHAGSTATGGAGGSAGGHAGSTATGGAGGSAGGHAGSTATGGAGGSAGGHAGSTATGGAAGGNGGSAAGGAAGSSAGGAGGAQTVFMYQVTLTGAAEVLAAGKTVSTGSGAATVTLNTATMTVSVQGSFTGLSSAATAAHIHGPAAPGATAPAIVVLTPQAAVAGALTGSGTLTAAQIADLKGGMDYINVHTTDYPDGEIRGQIQ